MDQPEFFKRMEERYAANVALSRQKNADYSDPDNAFSSFTNSELTSGVPVPDQLMYEMGKKINRIKNLLKRTNQVPDEKITDSLDDLCNYAVIMRLYLDSRNTSGTTPSL